MNLTKTCFRNRLIVLCLLCTSGLASAVQLYHRVPPFSRRTYDNYKDMRQEILNIIGRSKRRLWITSQYLTDGEVVSALYLAKFRGLDVKVLLGRKKAGAYMSRLRYLKDQSIDVSYIPDTFPFRSLSLILSDKFLYSIGSELNFLNKEAHFAIRMLRPKEAVKYAFHVRSALTKKIQDLPPRTGHVQRTRSASRERVFRSPYSGDEDGTYNYDHSTTVYSPPNVMPTKLPTKTKYQLIQSRQQDSENETP